jgi:diaminohydroxyphosphoribosylaminopyrimidine deaminase/5-amino-6-(5-phosphoribosylamino)uracil reductase
MQRTKSEKDIILTDLFYMKRALKLARKGEARVSPNPMVGAVIVKENRIIGEGYHENFGGNHAEINAILRSSEPIDGSTIYVTLEPCTHYGKTPPCVDRLISLNPARVVIGALDPNPLVSGKGINVLNQHGIETTVGVLEDACKDLNERFFKFIQTRIPFVTLKFAQTIDGRIATASGHSQWISSLPSRRFAHRLRSIHDAVLVGVGTVMADNPELTVRLARGRNPVRIIVDSHLRIPLHANVLKHQGTAKTIIATTRGANLEKRTILMDMGVDVMLIDEDSRHRIDMNSLLTELGKKEISSVLVEGGAAVITTILRQELADRAVIIIAPKIVGKGIEAVGDMGIERIDNALALSVKRIIRKGDDLIIDALVKRQKLA